MTHGDPRPIDVGLLNPVSAGRDDAASDARVLAGLVEAEIALVRAYAAVVIPDEAGAAGTIASDEAGATGAAVSDDTGATVPDESGAATAAGGEAAAAGPLSVAGLRAAVADVDALRDVAIDPSRLALEAVAGGNPVIALAKHLRAGSSDALRPWVHRGATSQDILDTALVLVARDASEQILADLARVDAALAAFAARERDTVAAGRTLTQHAVPTTVGLRAANWLRGVRRAASGLAEARAQLPAQLGGAGGTLAATVELFRGSAELTGATGDARPAGALRRDTAESASRGSSDAKVPSLGDSAASQHDPAGAEHAGASLGADLAHARARAAALRDAYADALGLARSDAPWHTTRWPVTELGDALTRAIDALGIIATDVATLSRTEIGELAEPSGGGSSAMPQKQNPARSVLIRSAAIRAPQLNATLHLASALAADERPDGAWHAEWPALRDLLRVALGAASHAADLTEGLRVNRDAVARNLRATDGLIVSERLSAVLGKDAAARVVAGVAEGGDIAALVRAEGGDPALLDPADYTGLAGDLVDRVSDN